MCMVVNFLNYILNFLDGLILENDMWHNLNTQYKYKYINIFIDKIGMPCVQHIVNCDELFVATWCLWIC
jgi:hypothetical protein